MENHSDDSRVIIYNCNMFIIEATVHQEDKESAIDFFSFANLIKLFFVVYDFG
jgi:hypothetical protein